MKRIILNIITLALLSTGVPAHALPWGIFNSGRDTGNDSDQKGLKHFKDFKTNKDPEHAAHLDATIADLTVTVHPQDSKAFQLNYKEIALTGLATTIAFPVLDLAETLSHELGHAGMATILHPGSVKKIRPFPGLVGGVFVNGYIELHPDKYKELRRYERMLISAAGPLAGAAFFYAGLKAIQTFDEYQKTDDLKVAIQNAKQKPAFASIDSDSIITNASRCALMFSLPFSLITNFRSESKAYELTLIQKIARTMRLASFADTRMESDGAHILRNLLNTQDAIPSRIIKHWNIGVAAVIAGGTYSMYKDAQEYNEKNNK